jgi:hypothetical protein
MLYGFSNVLTIGNTVITVGGGGASNNGAPGGEGANSTLLLPNGNTIIAYGGKNGGSPQGPPGRFGCGGGGQGFTSSNPTDQDGNFVVGNLFGVQQATGIVTLNASQFGLTGYALNGKSGALPSSNRAGGGGGTGDGNSPNSTPYGGSNNGSPGYDGRSLNISGSNVYYGGGGGSHALGPQSPYDYSPGAGGLGGGGGSGYYGGGPSPAYDGITNLGGGGGSYHGPAYPGGTKNSSQGGSGIVIIRYPYV